MKPKISSPSPMHTCTGKLTHTNTQSLLVFKKKNIVTIQEELKAVM